MSQVRDGWSTTSTGGADQGTVRRTNLALVLRSLRDGGARSRARLAADLGLNKATVSSLVTELRERGLVRDGSAERGAVGRPGTTVELDGRRCAASVPRSTSTTCRPVARSTSRARSSRSGDLDSTPAGSSPPRWSAGWSTSSRARWATSAPAVPVRSR